VIPLLAVAGWLDLACTTAFAGGVLFTAFVHPPSHAGRRVIQIALGMLPVALLLELVLTMWRLSPLAAAHGVLLLWDVLTTQWGLLWTMRCAGLLAIVACRRGSGLQVAVVAGWLLARSLQGHAGAHGTLAAVIDCAHLLAACAWLGGLVQFSLLSNDNMVTATPRLRRLITVAVAALLSAGIYAALLHVPSFDALVNSAYGRVLLIKLALLAVLVALGASNRFHHIPGLLIRRRPGPQRVRDTVRMEVVVGALVLLLSALLGALPMPHPPPG
jgi:putative copper resistance protein D